MDLAEDRPGDRGWPKWNVGYKFCIRLALEHSTVPVSVQYVCVEVVAKYNDLVNMED